MTPQELKNSILKLAIQGKLVEQRIEDSFAHVFEQRRGDFHLFFHNLVGSLIVQRIFNIVGFGWLRRIVLQPQIHRETPSHLLLSGKTAVIGVKFHIL